MIRESDLPNVFSGLFDAVHSLVGEYNSSRDAKLDIYSQPYVAFKVRRNHLPNGTSLTVKLTSFMEFEVEHWQLASIGAESEEVTKKLIPMVQEDGEVKFKYEDGEPMTIEETARSLMKPFFK